jgi:hypothetical protein
LQESYEISSDGGNTYTSPYDFQFRQLPNGRIAVVGPVVEADDYISETVIDGNLSLNDAGVVYITLPDEDASILVRTMEAYLTSVVSEYVFKTLYKAATIEDSVKEGKGNEKEAGGSSTFGGKRKTKRRTKLSKKNRKKKTINKRKHKGQQSRRVMLHCVRL